MTAFAQPRPAPPPAGGARGEARPRPGVEELLLAVGLVVNLAVALAARHFPYQDAPNHLARYVLLERALAGAPPADFQFAVVPTSYVAVDLLGALLVRAVGPAGALRALTVLALTLLPLGMYLLLRAAAPARRGWALVGVLFGFSWYFLAGFLNYTLGIALALVWLAAWWPRRATRSRPARLLLAAGALGLFLVHLVAPLVLLVVLWVDWLLDAATAAGRRWHPRTLVRRPRLLTALAVTVPVMALYLWTEQAGAGIGSTPGVTEFRPPVEKVRALAAPFYAFSLTQMAVMGAGYAAALAGFVLANRGRLRLDAFVVAAAAFVALFVVFPRTIPAAGDIDVRWLLPAYLLPFCMAGAAERGRQRGALVALLAACLLHAGVVHRSAVAIDRELAAFDAVLAQLPAGSRVLPLVADGRRHGRVSPYLHYAHWHTVARDGRVPALFSLVGTREGDLPYKHFAHFRARRQLYFPRNDWGTRDFSPLDWTRIAADYDFIVQAGDDHRVRAYLSAHARPALRAGEVTLYRVAPPR